MTNFILIPDMAVFETAHLAVTQNQTNNPSAELFKKAWQYHVHKKEKVIRVSASFDEVLKKRRYKSHKQKRQALLTVVRVDPDPLGSISDEDEEDIDIAQLLLAQSLATETDDEILIVSDNSSFRDVINQNNKTRYKAISVDDGVAKIKNALKG